MQHIPYKIPRVLISALRGGSGKTIVSVGIIAALSKLGKTVAPFKKGPDYIDAGWLSLAAGRPCFNLDTFMADAPAVCGSFLNHSSESNIDIAIIEGNRGLYDGPEIDVTTSSASLAKLLNTPVILCVDCTKSTRTMAAMVLGCLNFDPDVMIKGVILNRIAGSRHETLVRNSIEKHCGVRVIGAIPKLNRQYFPERHMGLVPTSEHTWAMDAIHAAALVMEKHVDIPALLTIAQSASQWPGNYMDSDLVRVISPLKPTEVSDTAQHPDKPKIGIFRDSAFQFYYPDNLEALQSAGADLVFISPLADECLPEIDALYIGGGFPETHAVQLSDNLQFRNEMKAAIDNGLPVYAECGGLMYLGKSLALDQIYPMAGVLPIVFGFSKQPQGHGYTIADVDQENPYFEKGSVIRGHEFHYSKVLEWKADDRTMSFHMSRGQGIHNNRDGICYKNVFATYTHIHTLGVKQWAPALVGMAKSYAGEKIKKTGHNR